MKLVTRRAWNSPTLISQPLIQGCCLTFLDKVYGLPLFLSAWELAKPPDMSLLGAQAIVGAAPEIPVTPSNFKPPPQGLVCLPFSEGGNFEGQTGSQAS